jgi:membrane protein YqaA with SNARE-associated domain
LFFYQSFYQQFDPLAGFSPMPYKIFTLGAGIANMALLPFILISLLARGTRFFLVAFFVKKLGDACDIKNSW